MSFIKNKVAVCASLSLALASCSQSSELISVSVHGHVIGETDDSFTLVQGNDTIVLPSNPDIKANKIFLQDSVVVRYSSCGENIVVDDIILIAHKQPLNNVDELFIGCWNDNESRTKMTFNSDQTTDTAGQRWLVLGKHFYLQTDNQSLEYDIVRVDAHTMILCHADHTLHMHRAN